MVSATFSLAPTLIHNRRAVVSNMKASGLSSVLGQRTREFIMKSQDILILLKLRAWKLRSGGGALMHQ